MRVLNPEKLKLSRGITPKAMSQIPNNIIPRFFVGFIELLL